MKKCKCSELINGDVLLLDQNHKCLACGKQYLNLSIDTEQFDTNRKHYPVDTGLFKYFPKALMYVSHVSWKGGQQHHPDEPLHWDRNKSTDDADAQGRHLLDEGEYDTDGILYQGKVCWRALAVLEKLLEEKNFKI
jgi:hypothetical protein